MTNSGSRVFYDKFHQHELWGKNLVEEFENVFIKQSQYSIVLLSEDYLTRMWTVAERQQIISRLISERGREYVLPIRMNGFEKDIPGLPNTIGFIASDGSEASIDYIVELLLKKLKKAQTITNSTDTYQSALQSISAFEEGLVEYDEIFFSIEAVNERFPKVARGDILRWEGNEFYWYKEPNKALKLFATTNSPDLTEICSVIVPDNWIGCGRWMIYYPMLENKDEDDAESDLIIVISLASKDYELVKAMEAKVTEHDLPSFFLAAVHFNPENTRLFYGLASARYQDLE